MDKAEKEVVSVEAEHVSQISCAGCQKILDVSRLLSFVKVKCPDCGMEQIVPAKFGSFLLIKQLGAGGMGVIYRAVDRELGRQVAIKVMKKSLGDNLEFVSSFRHEAQAAAALNHRNVVQIYSFGQYNGQPYIVMELVDGGKLDDLIEKGKTLNEVKALEIHLEVAEGLMAASDVGLVHGDVKPANVLFGKNGEAKVVDFGLARYIGDQQKDGPVWGTPYYIAPEKARGKQVDFRSDIYSLGATLFHVLTGKPPFDGPTSNDVVIARLNRPAPGVLDFNPDIHPETARLIARMLEAEPGMRYPSYPALLLDMRAALKAAKRSPVKPMHIPANIPIGISETKLRSLLRKLNWKIAALGVAVILLITGGIFGWIYYSKHQAQLEQEEAKRQLFQQLRETGKANFSRIINIVGLIDQTGTNIVPYARKADLMITSVGRINDPLVLLIDETDKVTSWLNEADDLLSETTLAVQQLGKAPDYETAKPLGDRIENVCNRLIAIHASLQYSLETVEDVYEEASALQGKALAEKRRIESEKAHELARQKAAVAAKAREKKKAEELHKMKPVLIQQELDEIERYRGANVTLIAQHKFSEAGRSFAPLESKLTLPETRAAFTNVMEIYNEIEKLDNWLKNSINSAPCKKCWRMGSDRNDIVKFDDRNGLTISLGEAGSLNVSWSGVTISQLLKIIDYYVKNTNLSESQQAEILKQAALLCYESGVFRNAEIYANAACKANPDLLNDLNRLMPDIVSPGE